MTDAPSRAERIELPEAVKHICYTVFLRAKGKANLTEHNDWFNDTAPHLEKWWAQALAATPPVEPSDEEIATKLCADWINQRVAGAFQTPATPTWDEVRHLIKQALARHRQAGGVI